METIAIAGIVLGGFWCLWHGVSVRFDPRLRAYRHRDPFRLEQEREGALWLLGGASLFVISAGLWWISRS